MNVNVIPEFIYSKTKVKDVNTQILYGRCIKLVQTFRHGVRIANEAFQTLTKLDDSKEIPWSLKVFERQKKS